VTLVKGSRVAQLVLAYFRSASSWVEVEDGSGGLGVFDDESL
jgi:hypothetical protein